MKAIDVIHFIAHIKKLNDANISNVTFYFKNKKRNKFFEFIETFYFHYEIDVNSYGSRYNFRIDFARPHVSESNAKAYLKPLMQTDTETLKEYCKAAKITVNDLLNFVNQFKD
jgi:hypothetical protein